MTDPNERQPMRLIDFVIIKILAIAFFICLTLIQIILVIMLTILKCVTYPIEFVSGFVLEAKDMCRESLEQEYD